MFSSTPIVQSLLHALPLSPQAAEKAGMSTAQAQHLLKKISTELVKNKLRETTGAACKYGVSSYMCIPSPCLKIEKSCCRSCSRSCELPSPHPKSSSAFLNTSSTPFLPKPSQGRKGWWFLKIRIYVPHRQRREYLRPTSLLADILFALSCVPRPCKHLLCHLPSYSLFSPGLWAAHHCCPRGW